MKLGQETLIDGMIGRLDDLPYGGAARIKSAEVALRLIAQSGLLAIVPEPEPKGPGRDWDSVPLEEKEAFLRGELQGRKNKT